VGIPGTGLFYTTTLPGGRSGGGRSASYSAPAVPTVRPEDRLTLGFFKRLITPIEEEEEDSLATEDAQAVANEETDNNEETADEEEGR
jgi:hypothetical protein